jgi:hypothetical protein
VPERARIGYSLPPSGSALEPAPGNRVDGDGRRGSRSGSRRTRSRDRRSRNHSMHPRRRRRAGAVTPGAGHAVPGPVTVKLHSWIEHKGLPKKTLRYQKSRLSKHPSECEESQPRARAGWSSEDRQGRVWDRALGGPVFSKESRNDRVSDHVDGFPTANGPGPRRRKKRMGESGGADTWAWAEAGEITTPIASRMAALNPAPPTPPIADDPKSLLLDLEVALMAHLPGDGMLAPSRQNRRRDPGRTSLHLSHQPIGKYSSGSGVFHCSGQLSGECGRILLSGE